MTTQTLIDQILNHPNTAFTPETAFELEVLSEPVLQQLLLSMTSVPNNNNDTKTLNSSVPHSAELQALLDDLVTCQEDLTTIAKEETRILGTLQKFGVRRPSVLTYNTRNAQQLNDVMIQKYIQAGTTPLAVVLQEGIAARGELRTKAINEILSCTSGVYTTHDLERMGSSDLAKLSNALVKTRPTSLVPDYSAVNVADSFRQVINTPFNAMEGVVSTEDISPRAIDWAAQY